MSLDKRLAEGAGFEPAIRFPAYTLSRRAPSATRPPLRSVRRGARGLSKKGRAPPARCAPSATRPPLRSLRRGAGRRSGGVWGAAVRRGPNRTCAGHKPSRPSRQAAKRSAWRRLRFFQRPPRREAARNRAGGGAFGLHRPSRRGFS